jgi:hypothetical protein
VCKFIRDFIQNLDKPEANQEPFKNPKANKGLIKYAQESFIQDDILWIRINKEEGTPRTVLFVPEILRKKIVQEAHGQLLTGHDGIAKTRERIKESYYWPNIDADVAKHISACQQTTARNSGTNWQLNCTRGYISTTPLRLLIIPNATRKQRYATRQWQNT